MQKPNSRTYSYNFVEVFRHNLESSHAGLRFPYTMTTLQTSFPLSNHFCWGEGGGRENPLVEVTVNSKEENSTLKTFVPVTFKNSASKRGLAVGGGRGRRRRARGHRIMCISLSRTHSYKNDDEQNSAS